MKKLFKASKKSSLPDLTGSFTGDDPLFDKVHYLLKARQDGIVYNSVTGERVYSTTEQRPLYVNQRGVAGDYSIDVSTIIRSGYGTAGINARQSVPITGDFCFDTWLITNVEFNSNGAVGLFGTSLDVNRSFVGVLNYVSTGFYLGTSYYQLEFGGTKTFYYALKHAAVDRKGSTVRYFIDGVLKGSITNSSTLAIDAGMFQVGTHGSYPGKALQGDVYLPRLTLASRYISNFNPLANTYNGGTGYQG